jgi:hypothetical protein
VYSLPPGSVITNGDTSDQTDLNTPFADLAADANIARPIVAGGTGATSAAAARTNLGATTVGSGLFTATNAAAARTTLELGTAATADAGDFATEAQGLKADELPDPDTLVAGDILYHDGTSFIRLPKGAADQVLKMNTGATAPGWADTGGGQLPLAAPVSVVTSAVASVEFELDNTAYRRFFLEYENAVPATNARFIVVQLSPDAGSTWRTSGYFGVFTSQGVGISKTDGLYLSDSSSSTAARGGVSGEAVIYGASLSGVFTQMVASSVNAVSNNTQTSELFFGGAYQTAEAHNRIRVIALGDGNIASGRFTLRGEPV